MNTAESMILATCITGAITVIVCSLPAWSHSRRQPEPDHDNQPDTTEPAAR